MRLQTRGQTAGRSQNPTPKSSGQRRNRRCGTRCRVRRARSLGCSLGQVWRELRSLRRRARRCSQPRNAPEEGRRKDRGSSFAWCLLMREEEVSKKNSVKPLTGLSRELMKQTKSGPGGSPLQGTLLPLPHLETPSCPFSP